MTKSVRIENADRSSYKVRVRVYEHGQGEPIATEILKYPADMYFAYITSTRHMVIDELPENDPEGT